MTGDETADFTCHEPQLGTRGASITLAAAHRSALPPVPVPAEGTLLAAASPAPSCGTAPLRLHCREGICDPGAHFEPPKSDLTGDHSVSKPPRK